MQFLVDGYEWLQHIENVEALVGALICGFGVATLATIAIFNLNRAQRS